jgi:predicted transcriptional regulator
MMPREAVFTVKLEADLHEAFMAEAEATHRPASQLVREFMREFVQRQREGRKHDRWFRTRVKEALDDGRPSMSHDVVIERYSWNY